VGTSPTPSLCSDSSRAAFFFEQAVLEEETEGYFRLGRLHVLHDLAGNPANEAEAVPEGDWADYIYGIEMLTRAVAQGHEPAFTLLQEHIEEIARQYASADDFRERITQAATEENGPPWSPKFHELCVAVQLALSVIAQFNEEAGHVGLSEEEIDALPSKTLEERISNTRCCICLADFEKEQDVRELDCRHLFHKVCVDEWLRRNHNCPLCKNTVSSPCSG